MEKLPPRSTPEVRGTESREGTHNPNRIFDWGPMPSNTDVPTTSENVYRQVKMAGVNDLFESGVVRNAASAGVGNPRKYGDGVYWTRGKDGEFHNVQPNHAVFEAPYEVANTRTVTADDLVGIHTRNETGGIENVLPAANQSEVSSTQDTVTPDTTSEQLAGVRERLGLSSAEQQPVDPQDTTTDSGEMPS